MNGLGISGERGTRLPGQDAVVVIHPLIAQGYHDITGDRNTPIQSASHLFVSYEAFKSALRHPGKEPMIRTILAGNRHSDPSCIKTPGETRYHSSTSAYSGGGLSGRRRAFTARRYSSRLSPLSRVSSARNSLFPFLPVMGDRRMRCRATCSLVRVV